MVPILIEGKDDHIKTKDRWRILREYFETNNIEYKEILTVDGNILSKIMCLIYMLDYSTIYYSVRLGVNPSPIRSIDFIKERL
jgi:glucose/mannose-6-phosphate isomerase